MLVYEIPERALLDHQLTVGHLGVHRSPGDEHRGALGDESGHGVVQMFEHVLGECQLHRQRAVVGEHLGRDRHVRVVGRPEPAGVVAGVVADAAGYARLAEHREEVAGPRTELGDSRAIEIVVGNQAGGEGGGEGVEPLGVVEGVLVGSVVVHQVVVERPVEQVTTAEAHHDVDVTACHVACLVRAHLSVHEHR